MNAQADNQEQRTHPNPTKHIFIILCLYLILYFASSHTPTNKPDLDQLKQLFNGQLNRNKTIPLILKSYVGHMEGTWFSKQAKKGNNFLWKNSGKFSTYIIQKNNKEFEFRLIIKNGQYIDDGLLRVNFKNVTVSEWDSTNQENIITIFPLSQIKDIRYEKQLIFQTKEQGMENLTKSNINLRLFFNEEDKLIRMLQISNFLSEKTMVLNFQQHESKLFGTIVLAFFMFLIAYTEFFSILSVLKSIFEGNEQASNFSFVTILLTLLWDAVFCIIAFTQAFTSEQSNENLILFIIPAFIFCLIFTNLELRLMLEIYRSNSGQNTNIRSILCKFNIIAYGCLFSLFPILYFMNFNNVLFILISLIYLPQIYVNGKNGKRPCLNSSYYCQFLLVRFIIIFYVKCFPYNIFQLQPQYFLGVGCLFLILCQFALLWIQKIYGSKTILPKCLLPPIFDYNTNIDLIASENIGIQIECSICLNNLKNKPAQLDGQPYSMVPCEIMRTPCGHNFHGACLVNWMNIKMECPQCRGKLPAYE